jgi:hypothetical protein
MTLSDVLEVSNALVIPAFGYIIILERRITKLQTQIDFLIGKLNGN